MSNTILKLNASELNILNRIGISESQIRELETEKLKTLIKKKYELYTNNKPIANTYPMIESSNITAQIEHEASTGKISVEIMYYLQIRGINNEDATSLIVSGFCGEILENLPFEFALEARELLKISMKDSVS